MWPFRRKQVPRSDAWSNSATGLGSAGRDKRLAAMFGLGVVHDLQAQQLWRGSDLAARIIEAYPREALRAGFCVKVRSDDVEDAKEVQEQVEAQLEELGAHEAFYDALCFERAYGGAAIWPVLNDQQADLTQPLRPERGVDLRALHVFEPQELTPKDWYDDPTDPKDGAKYGRPRTYYLQPLSPGGGQGGKRVEVHESRLIIFPGPRVSRAQVAGVRPGWGDGVLTKCLSVLRDFDAAFDSASHLLTDMSQGVFKMTGFLQAIVSDPEGVRARMQLMDETRSVVRAIVLDKDSEEDFERKSTPMDGLPALLDRFMLRLAAAADMPATLLMGMSPSGFNATGESDRAFFYDRVDQLRKRLRPRLEELVRLVFLSPDGPTGGKDPDVWCVEFPPLEQMTEKETAEIRKLVAETDALNLDRGVISTFEARSHYDGDGFSVDIRLDPDFEKVLDDRAATEADLAANPPETPPAGGTGETATPAPEDSDSPEPAGGPTNGAD